MTIRELIVTALFATMVCIPAHGQQDRDAGEFPSTLSTQNATYSEAIGPLIERKCLHCHRPGGIAPMTFMSYAEVRQWAKQSYTPLDALIRTRAMPPWPADPDVGEFSNPEFMTDAEIDLLLTWIDAGLPRGNGDYEGPAPPGEWVAGLPDHIFELPAYTVPEDTIGEYRTVRIETDFPSDRWLVGSEIQPGNRYAVRGVYGGVLGSYQPGQTTTWYPSSYGMLLERGATVDVQIHYFKDEGVGETDQSRIGLFFATDSGPRRLVREAPMRADPFTIPAETADFEVTTDFTFPVDGGIVSMMPIMHERGKRVTYTIRFPDGSEQLLLAIPEWNPNWKYRYVLQEPIPAPQGSIVTAVAIFDNSEANLKNPDPWSDVRMGPEGETFEGWLGYALNETPE